MTFVNNRFIIRFSSLIKCVSTLGPNNSLCKNKIMVFDEKIKSTEDFISTSKSINWVHHQNVITCKISCFAC